MQEPIRVSPTILPELGPVDWSIDPADIFTPAAIAACLKERPDSVVDHRELLQGFATMCVRSDVWAQLLHARHEGLAMYRSQGGGR